jgi:hypothetical protein
MATLGFANKPNSIQASAEVHSTTKEDGWIDELPEPEDYAYSFAVVGDPQYMTQYDARFGTTYVKDMYKWIVDNAEGKNIQHVIGVGDITHGDGEKEWNVAHEAISQMDGKVSYSLVRGNHDNRTTYFDKLFGEEDATYVKQQTMVSCYEYDWTYPGETTLSAKARNTAHEFSGTDVDYLVIALDFGAQDDVLEWANGVVEAYPNHTVIVSTHAYLSSTGAILDESSNDSPDGKNYDGIEGQYNGGVGGNEARRLWNGKKWKYQAKSLVEEPFNGGQDLWDKFISKHENISMVFSGHVLNGDMSRSQMVGDNGNIVEQIMINPQSLDDDGYYEQEAVVVGTDSTFVGNVAIFYCSEDGKTIDVQWYSTVKQKFYRENNQFQFNPLTTERGAPYLKVLTFGGGSATPTYATLEGQPIEICFKPDKYYQLGSLKLNGVDVTDQVQNNTYLFNQTEGYYQFKATFVEETRYAFLEQNDLSKGRLTYSLSELDATFREGDTFTIKVNPVEGCTVKTVTLNGTVLTADSEGNYRITIAAQDNVLVVEYDGEPIKPPVEEPPSDSSTDEDSASEGESSTSENESSNVADSSNKEEEENGCGSSLTGTLGVVWSLLIIAAAMILKKKNISKEIKL